MHVAPVLAQQLRVERRPGQVETLLARYPHLGPSRSCTGAGWGTTLLHAAGDNDQPELLDFLVRLVTSWRWCTFDDELLVRTFAFATMLRTKRRDG
jgi:hypothetical protein|eukprot:SAG25_NODE_1201_length_3643_cov_1.586625_4_plen_96_part_00